MSSNSGLLRQRTMFKCLTHLSVGEQVAYCIGHLVMDWAVCETLFRGVYACLLPNTELNAVNITWLSFNSTRSRCDLLRRTAIAVELNADCIERLDSLLSTFNSISRSRNMYCHGSFRADTTTFEPIEFESANLTSDERALKISVKKVDKGMVNEIKGTIKKCHALNVDTWNLLIALYAERKPQYLQLPPLPAGYLNR